MDDKDLCAGGVSALEQRIITMDRLDEIRSYGYDVEKVWECEVNYMLKKVENVKDAKNGCVVTKKNVICMSSSVKQH